MTSSEWIVDVIGLSNFEWLSKSFNRKTVLRDVPEDILDRVAEVDITLRDYGSDINGITSIALITFAYRMAGKAQHARTGPKDILLVKVLAAGEKRRREGEFQPLNRLWNAPLFELITGEVGERIRAMRTLNSPV